MKKNLLLYFVICNLCIISHTVHADNLVSVLGFYSIAPADGADIWGYVDPNTGKEYALMGRLSNGLMIFDVTDPTNPILVSHMRSVPGFDVKVWKNYAYTVTGSGGGFGAIIDLTNPAEPVQVGSFNSSHNIFISENGYMFQSGPGTRIMDLNNDPTNPVQIWRVGTDGHDAAVIGNRLYDFHGSPGTFIYDISDISNPNLIGSITNSTIFYHHSGWTSKDGDYLFITDEGSRHPFPDITVWDIRNVSEPQRVGEWGDARGIVHNLYIIGDYAFTSYYYSGFRVFDISDPTNIKVVAEYDTSPISREGFGGAFGVYPFAPSGNIYVSDQSGLFIFKFDRQITDISPTESYEIPTEFTLGQNYPNPFNPKTQIDYSIATSSDVNIIVYNILGQPIRSLVDQYQTAGQYIVTWNGKDDFGIDVSAGYYIYKMQAGAFVENKRMVYLK